MRPSIATAPVEQYRAGNQLDDRRANLRDSILVYKKRCEIMNIASIIGLASAVLLISSLIIGELALAVPSIDSLKLVCIWRNAGWPSSCCRRNGDRDLRKPHHPSSA